MPIQAPSRNSDPNALTDVTFLSSYSKNSLLLHPSWEGNKPGPLCLPGINSFSKDQGSSSTTISTLTLSNSFKPPQGLPEPSDFYLCASWTRNSLLNSLSPRSYTAFHRQRLGAMNWMSTPQRQSHVLHRLLLPRHTTLHGQWIPVKGKDLNNQSSN